MAPIKKKQRLGDVTQMLHYVNVKHVCQSLLGYRLRSQGRIVGHETLKMLTLHRRHYRLCTQSIKNPHEHAQQQGGCGFIDLERMLQRNSQIADYKNDKQR